MYNLLQYNTLSDMMTTDSFISDLYQSYQYGADARFIDWVGEHLDGVERLHKLVKRYPAEFKALALAMNAGYESSLGHGGFALYPEAWEEHMKAGANVVYGPKAPLTDKAMKLLEDSTKRQLIGHYFGVGVIYPMQVLEPTLPSNLRIFQVFYKEKL